MSTIRKSIQPLAKLCSLSSLIQLSGQPIALPFYHTVSDDDLPHIKQLYSYKNVAAFRQDLLELTANFKPISLQQLIEINKTGEQPDKPVFHLSFDDGLREVFEVVRPILLELGIPATAFINTDFIDNKALFNRYKQTNITDTEFLKAQKPYMTTQQIKQWIDDGFTIGGHSMNHPNYADIAFEDQVRQTMGSVDYLQDQFKLNYRAFAFPFTDDGVSKQFFDALYNENGINLDISFGTAGLKHDVSPKHMQRIVMEGTNASAGAILKTEYLYYILKRPLGKNHITRS